MAHITQNPYSYHLIFDNVLKYLTFDTLKNTSLLNMEWKYLTDRMIVKNAIYNINEASIKEINMEILTRRYDSFKIERISVEYFNKFLKCLEKKRSEDWMNGRQMLKLVIGNINLNEESWELLSKLRNFDSLKIDNCSESPVKFERFLKNSPQLKSLTIRNMFIAENALKTSFTNLNELCLENCTNDSSDGFFVYTCTNMKKFTLKFNEDSFFLNLSPNLTKVTYDFSSISAMTSKILHNILLATAINCPKLEDLSIIGYSIMEDDVWEPGQLCYYKNLKYMNFQGTMLTDELLQHLFMPKLLKAELKETSIKTTGLEYLVNKCKLLEELSIGYNENLTNDHVYYIVRALQNLRKLEIDCGLNRNTSIMKSVLMKYFDAARKFELKVDLKEIDENCQSYERTDTKIIIKNGRYCITIDLIIINL